MLQGYVAPAGHSALFLRRLAFPQLRLVRDDMPDLRRGSEACWRRCCGLRGGRNKQIPERWHHHLVVLLLRSSHFTIDERGNVTLRYWHTSPKWFPGSAWVVGVAANPCQRDRLA